MTKTYEIANAKSGFVLGRYDAETEAEALEIMARDAGYKTYADACEVAPVEDDEIVVTIVDDDGDAMGRMMGRNV